MSTPDQTALPVQPIWARDDIFPPKPSDQGRLGFLSPDGEFFGVEDEAALKSIVRGESKQRARLVWTEENEHCVPAEEVSWLGEAVLANDRVRAADAMNAVKMPLYLFGGLFTFYFIQAKQAYPDASWLQILSSQTIGGLALFLTIFGLMPWYEAWKEQRRVKAMTADRVTESAPEARFDLWMAAQKGPVSKVVLGLMLVLGLLQLYVYYRSGSGMQGVIEQAALVKQAVSGGEGWRYLTAPFLHGNPIHWLFNASALLFLGKRVEALARWPHVLNILVGSGLAGGMLSVMLQKIYPAPSVGASGAIVGLLGFLLVFEFTHRQLVPRSARRRLIAVVGGLVVIGLVGIQMVDNGAHAGGLLAGMAYSFIVFPASRSPIRPSVTRADLIVSGVSALIIVYAAVLTAVKLISLL